MSADELHVEVVPLEIEQLEEMIRNFERSGEPMKLQHVAAMKDWVVKMKQEREALDR